MTLYSAIKSRRNYINKFASQPADTHICEDCEEILFETVIIILPRKKCKIIETCPICQDKIIYDDNLNITKCFHKFHNECINKWLTIKDNCPLCRTNLI